LIALLHPETGPILILSEVQSLEKLGEEGRALLSTIVVTLERRKSLHSLIPVVFETSDALWTADIPFAPSVRRSREAFKGVLIRSFTKGEGHKALVLEKKLLANRGAVWSFVGGSWWACWIMGYCIFPPSSLSLSLSLSLPSLLSLLSLLSLYPLPLSMHCYVGIQSPPSFEHS
jgi:hypothetical protein